GGGSESLLPVISGNGRYVGSSSSATNLLATSNDNRRDVFLRVLTNGTTELASVTSSGGDPFGESGAYGRNSIDDDGRFVAFDSGASDLVAGDTNGQPDVFVRDR